MLLPFFGVPGVGSFPADAEQYASGAISTQQKFPGFSPKCVGNSSLDYSGATRLAARGRAVSKGRQVAGQPWRTQFWLTGSNQSSSAERCWNNYEDSSAGSARMPASLFLRSCDPAVAIEGKNQAV